MTIDKKREKNEGDLAEEFLQHELMNETRAYIERGREWHSLDDDEIADTWVATFERWFDTKTIENARAMDDAAAEIRLRGLEMPYERVENQAQALKAGLARLDTDYSRSPEIGARSAIFSRRAVSRRTETRE